MERMSGLDARFLFTETPTTHLHTIKAVVVDVSGRSDTLTPETFLDLLASRLGRLPVLRRRVVPVPLGLGPPVVIDDPDFDLGRHVHHVTAPSPGDDRALADLVAGITSVPLPRDRPLWDLTVVDGLTGDRLAFIIKIHHCLADGKAAVALLENAFVVDDSDAVVEPFEPEPVPTRSTLLRSAAGAWREAASTLPTVARQTATGLRDRRVARRRQPTAVVGPFAGPRTPLNVSLGPHRTVALLPLPLGPMLAAKSRAGVSLNDLFLSLCAGGLRRYLARGGSQPPSSLVASVPMATGAPRPHLGGNHVDNLFLPLHTDVADARARLDRIHRSTAAARRVRETLGTELFEMRAELAPPPAQMLTTRAWAGTGLADRLRPPVNLVASNVPGPRTPLELEGGRVTALWSSGPILEGIGLNITAWTYVDTMYVTLLGCPESLPDPWQLAGDIESELEELCRAD